jgi:RNA polymerase sigma factor FliA
VLEVGKTWEDYQLTHNPKIKEALVNFYFPLVRQIATKILKSLRRPIDLEDLMSDGSVGLLKAIDKFNLERGVKFETYATPVIRGAILNGIRNLDWVPERIRNRGRKLEEAERQFAYKHGRLGTPAEIAAEIKVDVNEMYELIADLGCSYILSLDQPVNISDDSEISIMDTVEDAEGTHPDLEFMFKEERELIREKINTLPERERAIIELHYFEGMSFERVTHILGISKQRVSQLHSKAIRNLKEHLNTSYGDSR